MTKKQLILDFISKQIWLILATIFVGVVSSLLTILIPVSIGKYYDLLFNFHSKRSVILDYFPEQWQNNIPSFIVFFVVMIVLRFIFNFSQRYLTSYLGENFTKKIREELFEKQLFVNLKIYEEKGIGKYLLRYSGDLNSIRSYLTIGILRFAIDLILLTVALFSLLMISYQLTLIVLIGMGVTVLVVFFLNKFIYKASVQHRNKKSGLLSFVNRTLLNISSVKAFNRYAIEKKRFNKRSDKIYRYGIEYQILINLVQTIVPFILYLSLAVVLYFTYIFKNQSNGLESNELLAFILILITILPVLRRTLRVPTKWKVGNISIEKLLNIYNLPEEKTRNNETKIKFKKGDFFLKNITIKNTSISNLSIEIKGAEFTTILFKNEADQFHFLKCLIGLENIQNGRLKVDNQNIENIDKKSLRKKIGISSIRFPFTGRTVYEAISYSKSNDKKIIAEKVLNKLQNGVNQDEKLKIDTFLDEGISNLSLTHKVIISCARCFLSNKPILLIDGLSEYTDLPVYKNIIAMLIELKNKKKTIIVLDKKCTAEINQLTKQIYEI